MSLNGSRSEQNPTWTPTFILLRVPEKVYPVCNLSQEAGRYSGQENIIVALHVSVPMQICTLTSFHGILCNGSDTLQEDACQENTGCWKHLNKWPIMMFILWRRVFKRHCQKPVMDYNYCIVAVSEKVNTLWRCSSWQSRRGKEERKGKGNVTCHMLLYTNNEIISNRAGKGLLKMQEI